jgi:SSS family solute:Na+ symporter
MIVAAIVVVLRLPDDVSLDDALAVAGSLGRLDIIDTTLDLDNRYTLWSGLTGGLFLMLSYFGTDQSQVQRYLGGRSVTESRLGLLFNGILKIPMQFLILFVGVMVFVFYQFSPPPAHFNQAYVDAVYQTEYAEEYRAVETEFAAAFEAKQATVQAFLSAREADAPLEVSRSSEALRTSEAKLDVLRVDAKAIMQKALNKGPDDTKDSDYIFISFVVNNLPVGLIGLLMAVIMSAAMSSTASELNALGTTTVVDFYKRLGRKPLSDRHIVIATKSFTVLWGLIAIAGALAASAFDNLIEAVNLLGSLFYGTVLGIFLVAFFFKFVRSTAVFAGALVAEAVVLTVHSTTDVAYLWFNLIGCGVVIIAASVFQVAFGGPKQDTTA